MNWYPLETKVDPSGGAAPKRPMVPGGEQADDREGVAKLRVGDRAILVIPGKLAYGPKGVPNVIPPDATLIFIVEVVDVKAKSLTD